MIAVLLASQLLAPAQSTSVVYDDVPVEVERLVVVEWPGGKVVADTVRERSASISVRGAPERSSIVMLLRQDGAYLLDGPFVWPAVDSLRTLAVQWHRTIRGVVPEGVRPLGVDWIRADALASSWPVCRQAEREWSCWGVRPENRGVLVLSGGGFIFWTTTAAAGANPLRRARWGRLLVVGDAAGGGSGVHVVFAYPVAPPSGRLRGIRLETAVVSGARAVAVSPGVTWLAGSDIPPKAWAEVRTDAAGPVYLPLQQIADGPASVPLHVSVPERHGVEGRVVGSSGNAAGGTLLTAFRLIDPPPQDGSRTQPRRVLAAETIADDSGAFTIDGLGEADYEVVAWHAQLGRASVALPAHGSDLLIRLGNAGVARGRVLVGGKPREGVSVVSVPELAAFSSAVDITEVKGGDAHTGADGRFSVMLAASGGGELRIGGGTLAVRRVPLARGPVAALDLGDIELGLPIDLVIVFDRDPGCGVRAAGPVGRAGLQVVPVTRSEDGAYRVMLPESGMWEFTLACADAKHALSPAVVQIDAAQSGKEVRFVVR
jgi:hypothetical protein